MTGYMGGIDTLKVSVVLTGPVKADRAVTFTGAQAGADAKVYGIAALDGIAGDAVALTAIGLRDMEAGGVLAAGDDVVSDAEGRPVAAAAGDENVFGTAVSAAATLGARVSILIR